jgi:hypothetical protein
MKAQLVRILVTIIIGAAVVGLVPYALSSTPELVSIDGSLYQQDGDTLTVIVTGSDGKAISRAVENLGGEVTSAGWLVDTITAVVPAAQLDELAGHPNVYSITAIGEISASRD